MANSKTPVLNLLLRCVLFPVLLVGLSVGFVLFDMALDSESYSQALWRPVVLSFLSLVIFYILNNRLKNRVIAGKSESLCSCCASTELVLRSYCAVLTQCAIFTRASHCRRSQAPSSHSTTDTTDNTGVIIRETHDDPDPDPDPDTAQDFAIYEANNANTAQMEQVLSHRLSHSFTHSLMSLHMIPLIWSRSPRNHPFITREKSK